MSVAQKKAELVANVMVAKYGVPRSTCDLLLILTILSLIFSAIRLLMECRRSSKDAIDKARHPGILGRIKLRRIIRETLQKQHPDNQDIYKLRGHIELSLRSVGAATSVEEMVKLFEEVKKQDAKTI